MYIGHCRRVTRCGFMPRRIGLGHGKISQRSIPQSLYTHLSSFISLVLPLLVPPLLLAPISLVVPSFFCYLRSAMCQARLPGLPVGHRRDSPLFWVHPPILLMLLTSIGAGWLARLGPWFARRPQEGVPLWSYPPRLIFPLAGTCYPMPLLPPFLWAFNLAPSPVLPPLFLRFE